MSASNALARPATNTPAITNEQTNALAAGFYEPAEITLIRQQYAKGLNEGQFQMFVAEAKHRGLDILKGHFQSIKFQGDNPTFFPTIHGVMYLANKHPMNDGIDEISYCGPDGIWRDVWVAKDAPVAARAIVHRKDRSRPTTRVAYLAERKRTGPLWTTMPRHMIAKVALSDALKASGLIDEAESWMYEDVVALPDGTMAEVVDGQQVNAFKRAHAVAASHGRSHEELRQVVKQIEPGIDSMREASPASIHTAASVIDHMDPEYVDQFIEGKVALEDPVVEAKPLDEPEWDLAPNGKATSKGWSQFWQFMKSNYQVSGEQFNATVGSTAQSFGSPAAALAAYREVTAGPPVSDLVDEGEVEPEYDTYDDIDPETGELLQPTTLPGMPSDNRRFDSK